MPPLVAMAVLVVTFCGDHEKVTPPVVLLPVKVTLVVKHVKVVGCVIEILGKAPFCITATTVLFIQQFNGSVTANV